MSDEGIDASAILLLSLGEEEAAEVFKYLSPKEVQKLGAAMSKLRQVSRERIDEVLDKFHAEASAQTSLGVDSAEFIRAVLNKALGPEKADLLIDRILHGGDTSGIESLKWMEAPAVAELIKNEHPQIVASILVHLERDHAADILKHFGERMRGDIVLRIATLEGIQPSALRDLNEVLAKVLAGSDNLKKAAMGGVRIAAEILNFLGSGIESSVLEVVKAEDEELAQKIQDEMLVFDDLVDLDDRGLQLLLREVQSESLIVALKGANEALREKVFKNMSTRAADILREDLEAKGPVRVVDVEREQKEILKIVRRLAEEGQIALGGKAEEAYV
jgi:flagellar motor switch protein FliG